MAMLFGLSTGISLFPHWSSHWPFWPILLTLQATKKDTTIILLGFRICFLGSFCVVRKPVGEGGEDGTEMHPELSVSLEVLLLKPGLQKTISHLIWSKVVNSLLQQHHLLSLPHTKAYVKTTQTKESTEHKCFPFQRRLFRRAMQCKVCSSHCHKLTFSQCRSPKAILRGEIIPHNWLGTSPSSD